MRVKDVAVPEIPETVFKASDIMIHNPDIVERVSQVGGKTVVQMEGQRQRQDDGEDRIEKQDLPYFFMATHRQELPKGN